LAFIGQVVTATTREQRAGGIQHRDATSAASAVDAGATGKPRPSAAKMTIGPSDRHPLFDGFPLCGQKVTGLIVQDNGILLYAHVDGARRFS